LKKPITKQQQKNRTGGMSQGIGLKFKPQHCKNKKKKKEKVRLRKVAHGYNSGYLEG
jgi:hypothetical protein